MSAITENAHCTETTPEPECTPVDSTQVPLQQTVQLERAPSGEPVYLAPPTQPEHTPQSSPASGNPQSVTVLLTLWRKMSMKLTVCNVMVPKYCQWAIFRDMMYAEAVKVFQQRDIPGVAKHVLPPKDKVQFKIYRGTVDASIATRTDVNVSTYHTAMQKFWNESLISVWLVVERAPDHPCIPHKRKRPESTDGGEHIDQHAHPVSVRLDSVQPASVQPVGSQPDSVAEVSATPPSDLARRYAELGATIQNHVAGALRSTAGVDALVEILEDFSDIFVKDLAARRESIIMSRKILEEMAQLKADIFASECKLV